jgi:hypothetical protein
LQVRDVEHVRLGTAAAIQELVDMQNAHKDLVGVEIG